MRSISSVAAIEDIIGMLMQVIFPMIASIKVNEYEL